MRISFFLQLLWFLGSFFVVIVQAFLSYYSITLTQLPSLEPLNTSFDNFCCYFQLFFTPATSEAKRPIFSLGSSLVLLRIYTLGLKLTPFNLLTILISLSNPASLQSRQIKLTYSICFQPPRIKPYYLVNFRIKSARPIIGNLRIVVPGRSRDPRKFLSSSIQ